MISPESSEPILVYSLEKPHCEALPLPSIVTRPRRVSAWPLSHLVEALHTGDEPPLNHPVLLLWFST